MAGVSRGSSVVPPWPTATPFRRCNPRVTYLHRCGITLGACWCPWIHRRSSPSVSIRRRVCTLFSGSLTRGTRCQWLNGPLVSFIQIQISYNLAKIISPVSEIQTNFVIFHENITCTMFSGKNNCYDLILLFKYKLISVDILLLFLWNFYALLWVVWECYDKYFMIFGVLYLWYEIHVDPMAVFLFKS